MGELPVEWDLCWAPLPADVVGLTSWRRRTITIDPSAPAAVQRSTLAHEIVHAERGPAPPDPVSQAREELVVEKEAARRLIGVRELGEAMAESSDPRYVAETLRVDPDLLATRLRWLHPSERHYLRRRLQSPTDPTPGL